MSSVKTNQHKYCNDLKHDNLTSKQSSISSSAAFPWKAVLTLKLVSLLICFVLFQRKHYVGLLSVVIESHICFCSYSHSNGSVHQY